MAETKKDVWQIDVTRDSSLKVAFGEPVTKEEAMLLYAEQEYEDVLDEEDHGFEVVAAR